MNLLFDLSLADGYASNSQRARRLTEGWFEREMYCVSCGNASLRQHPNNARGNDFRCGRCGMDVELKSGRSAIGATVPDGAYDTMMQRLRRPGGGPHLALMRYDVVAHAVTDLLVIAAPFLTADAIVRRKPLSSTARRAGWVGCNIHVGSIPQAGRIVMVRDRHASAREAVVEAVRRTSAIRGDLASRTWLVDVARCVERLDPEFGLPDIYAAEAALRARHPANRNIRPKIRQQLQRLRDAGLLEFLGNGRYRRLTVLPAGQEE